MQTSARDTAGATLDGNESAPFLTDDEIKNLTIRAGTLTEEEREIINHHIEVDDQDARGAALAAGT